MVLYQVLRVSEPSMKNVFVILWFWLQRRCKTSVKKVSVTLRFSLQCRYKTLYFVCFYQPALCSVCVCTIVFVSAVK